MSERMKKEIELLTKKFGNVQCDENLEWILIDNYPLPQGWNRNETDVLLLVPAGYPSTKPYGFRVPEGLRLTSGAMPTNYNEKHVMLERNWGQFSISVEEWKPTDDVISGHNLVTFMIGVKARLEEIN